MTTFDQERELVELRWQRGELTSEQCGPLLDDIDRREQLLRIVLYSVASPN